jgi:hypothetical protein
MTRKIFAAILSLLLVVLPLGTSMAGLGDNPPNPIVEPASITAVEASPVSHTAGVSAVIRVAVTTSNVPNGTAVTARLARNDLTPVAGVERADTMNANQALLTLNVPDNLQAGIYRIMVSITGLSLSDSGTVYTILQPAQPTIIQTSSSASTGNVGVAQDVLVEVSTAAIDNGTVVRISLQDGSGTVIEGVNAEAFIFGNAAQATLNMPNTLEQGIYRIKVDVAGLSDTSLTYTVLGEGQQNEAPAARNVRIIGTPQVGNVLTGAYVYYDAEADIEGSSTYRWYRSDALTSSRTQIGSQITHTLTTIDQGKYIWFEVIPVASSGELRGLPVLSAPVGSVSAAPGGGGGGGFFPPSPPPPSPQPDPIPTPDPDPDPIVDEDGAANVPIPEPDQKIDDKGNVTEETYRVSDDSAEQVRSAIEEGATVINFQLGATDAEAHTPKVNVTIAPAVLAAAAEGANVSITISTPSATLTLPPALVQALAAQGQSLEMTIERALFKDVVDKLPPKTAAMSDPLVINTSIKGLTGVTVPMNLVLPASEAARNAFLNSLRMFAIHSDGEQRYISDLTFDIDDSVSPPILKAVTFFVDKFSTFTLVTVPTDAITTRVGQRGYTFGSVRSDMVACYYKGNDTMMPVRMLEAFGVEFDWDQATLTATLSYMGTTVKLTIGSTDAYINGVRTPIVGASGRLVAPELAPGRTMIPLRFVSENLKFKVHWDPSHVITISLP